MVFIPPSSHPAKLPASGWIPEREPRPPNLEGAEQNHDRGGQKGRPEEAEGRDAKRWGVRVDAGGRLVCEGRHHILLMDEEPSHDGQRSDGTEDEAVELRSHGLGSPNGRACTTT